MEDASVTREPERRDKPRKQVTRSVVLSHAGLGTEAGRIKDVSLDGAFVQSGLKDLPMFATVELTVTMSGGEQPRIKEYRLPATVVRYTEDGAGLKFYHLDMESYSALLDLLYSS
jgi:hypothetical protein